MYVQSHPWKWFRKKRKIGLTGSGGVTAKFVLNSALLTIKAQQVSGWRHSCVFVVNVEQDLHMAFKYGNNCVYVEIIVSVRKHDGKFFSLQGKYTNCSNFAEC